MVNLIVSGHGEIATGLKSSLSVIAGDFEHISFINFLNDAEKLKADMEKVINEKPNEKFLILTDLVGGTPFKTAVIISQNKDSIKVIGGVNLPMLISIVYNTEESLEILTNLAIKSAKDGIKEFSKS